ncbi:hypothetical protein ACIBBD_08435 [Streptomyces sp. NPDC051315]|uniref:SCO2400 family protein n=1 Tax=Streptomyces sp. NPDC051315 TaxID=3365650 RepID=UPI00379EEC89
MDYCSTCRRHLNGALVCPGCGAYAPDIAPITDGHTAVARVTTARTATVTGVAAAWEPTSGVTWPEEGVGDAEAAEAADRDETPASGPSGEPAGVASAPSGRAARRRQLARWKKTQRRALVATAVAFVGGGLTVAANPFDRHSTDRAQAATTPDTTGMGAAEEPVTEQDVPSAVPSSPTVPARSAATDDARRKSTAPANTRPDATTVLPTAVPSTPQPRTTPPTSGYDAVVPDRIGTGTGDTAGSAATADTPVPQTSAPPAAEDPADSPASPPSPAPSATAPEKLCLLVVCLG